MNHELRSSVGSVSRRSKGAGLADRSEEVLVALRRIIRATDLHSKQLAKVSGLTISQVVVLRSIRALGEVTTGEVARRVNLSQGTVTTVLDRLEGRGFIERYRSASDRRVVHARLTAQGRAALKQAPSLLQERFLNAFASLDPQRQHEIVLTLQEVAAMMGADALDAAPLLDLASATAVES